MSRSDRSARRSRIWRTAALAFAAVVTVACAAASAEDAQTLRESLELGHGPDHYWQQIEQLGYEVTAVNYDREEYLEYEVVRGDNSYEVQIELDDERLATGIEVTANRWKADETSAALEADLITVPAGTTVTVVLQEALSSATSRAGQTVAFEVSEPVASGERVLLPEGAIFTGSVVLAEKAERPQKPGKLEVDIDRLAVRGVERDVSAEFVAKGKGSHEDDARDIGIGAAIGAIVGAIAEGGEGAIAGIVLGGGGVFLATKGEDVELPAGTQLTIELTESVQVPAGS